MSVPRDADRPVNGPTMFDTQERVSIFTGDIRLRHLACLRSSCQHSRTALSSSLGPVVIALLAIVAILPASADALVNEDPNFWKQTAERRATVDRLMYSQSPQSIPSSYDPVQEAEQILRSQQRSLPASNPQVPRLWQQVRSVTAKSALSTPLRALGTVSLAVGTFELGWKIGNGFNAKFLRIGLPANGEIPAAYSSPQLSFRSAGQTSQLW
jgi:hypothetical protein